MSSDLDLHLHTCASDGLWSAEELVRRVAAAGLAGLAVTDHDSLEAVPRAVAAGASLGLEVIPGIELAARWQGREVHLLGLWLSPGRELDGYLRERRRQRHERAREMVRRLEAAGLGPLDLSLEADHVSWGRPHVAAALVRAGRAQNIEDAFRRYLTPGKAGYLPQPSAGVEEMISRLQSAGAAVVWAHPGLSGLEVAEVPWASLLDGLEVDHPRHDPAQRRRLREAAARLDLVPTGGSDSHGTPGRDRVGEAVTPREAALALYRRSAARR